MTWQRSVSEMKELMEMRQKSLHDEATRLFHAEKRAKEQKALEIAKNLKQAGIDMAIIAENTGLSRETVEKL